MASRARDAPLRAKRPVARSLSAQTPAAAFRAPHKQRHAEALSPAGRVCASAPRHAARRSLANCVCALLARALSAAPLTNESVAIYFKSRLLRGRRLPLSRCPRQNPPRRGHRLRAINTNTMRCIFRRIFRGFRAHRNDSETLATPPHNRWRRFSPTYQVRIHLTSRNFLTRN